MPRCYTDCKHNNSGWCNKYNEEILVSKHFAHPGLLLHPLEYLTTYYNENVYNLADLVAIAEEHLDDETSVSICNYYSRYDHMSIKQRKLLLHNLFNCYERKEQPTVTTFTQVE